MKHLLFYTTALCTFFALAHNALAKSCGGDCTYHIEGTKLVIDGGSAIPYSAFMVQNIGVGSFASITEVSIPDSIKTIGSFAFESVPLASLTIPTSVTTIGDYAFSGTGLTNVTIPGSVTTIGEGAFRSTKLASVTIPDSVTTISSSAFSNCKQLESVTIPSSVTTIGAAAFENTKLASVIIPEGVTTIGNRAFAGAPLISLTIPDSVTSIASNAFSGVSGSLKELNIPDFLEGFNWVAMIDGGTYESAASQYERTYEVYELFLEYGYTEEKAREMTQIDQRKQELDAAAEALRNKIASLTINCSGDADVCKQNILNALPQSYKDALGDNEPFIFAGASYKQKNPDGSVAYYTGDGKLKTIRGKKIYTVQEAEEVTKNGDKFHVYLTYK